MHAGDGQSLTKTIVGLQTYLEFVLELCVVNIEGPPFGVEVLLFSAGSGTVSKGRLERAVSAE